MVIFHDINGLTYILALGFLGLWFLFSSHRKWNIIMGMAFFLFLFLNFILTMGLSLGPVKYFIFSKNLILISFFGLVFQLFRKNKIALLIAIVTSILASLQIFKLNIVQDLLPKTFTESMDQGELLIETTSENIADIQTLLKKYKGKLDKAFYPLQKGTSLDNFYLIDIPDDISDKKEELLKSLNQKELIHYGEYNDVIQLHPIEGQLGEVPKLFISVNDPMIDNQWAMSALRIDDWYKLLMENQKNVVKTIKIAVLDTGIDANHEDLHHMLAKDDLNSKDPVGHGTHCAGIIAAETNNHKGVASPAFYNDLIQIMPVKVLNRLGFGTQAQIIKGMVKAVDEGAGVLSMSLGGISDTPKQKAYLAAVQYALDHNAIVVTSAGNSSSSARRYAPANVPGVICVTALAENGQLANFSNFLDGIEWGIAAPGVNIMSTYPDNQYKSLSGTSMAAPFVSSTIGIMKTFAPDLSPEEIYQIILNTSLPTDDVNRSGGLIQPAEALKEILAKN